MRMSVVDASFAGAWILPDESSDAADALLREALNGKRELCVPFLWHYEICNLLTMAKRRGRIQDEHVERAVHLLQHVPMKCHDHQEVLAQRRILIFADRFSLSAYDAAYLELADRLQCALHSSDARLKTACEEIGLDAPG